MRCKKFVLNILTVGMEAIKCNIASRAKRRFDDDDKYTVESVEDATNEIFNSKCDVTFTSLDC